MIRIKFVIIVFDDETTAKKYVSRFDFTLIARWL
jgi:hypothetical protein